MITLTPTAIEKLRQLLTENTETGNCLRIYVEGGGCSGFSYKPSIDTAQEGDTEFEFAGIKVVVDPLSLRYVENITLDYKTEGLGGFAFINPDAGGTCGCGQSFTANPDKT